jgi:hypothetical protein
LSGWAKALVCLQKPNKIQEFEPECLERTLEKLIRQILDRIIVSANEDIVDYIKEVRMILADSIDTLLNLQADITLEQDEAIIPITSKAELVDITYDIAYEQKIKSAQDQYIKRDPF